MKRPIENTSRFKAKQLAAILEALPGGTSDAQRRRILAALATGTLSTFEASRFLDVYYPPVRIFELRNDGHKITLHWVYAATECGAVHRIGAYSMAGCKP